MGNSRVDRDVNYMKENWGTTHLITDYIHLNTKVIQEVMYDPEVKLNSKSKQDLFEAPSEDDEFDYGVEPTFKIGKNQKLLRD